MLPALCFATPYSLPSTPQYPSTTMSIPSSSTSTCCLGMGLTFAALRKITYGWWLVVAYVPTSTRQLQYHSSFQSEVWGTSIHSDTQVQLWRVCTGGFEAGGGGTRASVL